MVSDCLLGLLFFGSQEIAISMGIFALQPLMEVVSFTFLLVPILSFYRGNFQGHLLMVPSGISQVMEQFVRVGVILVARCPIITLVAPFTKRGRWP